MIDSEIKDKPTPSTDWKSVAFALIVIAAGICLTALGFNWLFVTIRNVVIPVFDTLSNLDTAIIVALITGTVSILAGVFGSIAKIWMKKAQYLREHREAPYRRLIKLFYDFQMRLNSDNPVSQTELQNTLNEFNQELTLWGSSKAIKMWGKWRVSSGKGELDGFKVMFGMEKDIQQMRKDLGQSGRLAKGDILRLFVNDVDKYL